MKKHFKSFEEAEEYFCSFDITKLKKPHDFAVLLQLAATAKEMKDQLSAESIKFWTELEKDVHALMENEGIILINVSECNMAQTADLLIRVLSRNDLARLLLNIDDFSAFQDAELNSLWKEMCLHKGRYVEELCERLSAERLKRNPTLC